MKNYVNCATVLTLAIGISVTPAAAQQASHAHEHREYKAATSAELERQLAQVRKATERYRDHAAAVADGFKRFGADGPLMGEHWYHPDRVGAPLDLARPSTLMYARINGERELIGVAYSVYRRPDDPLPEGFTGEADEWHVHDVGKITRALTEERPFIRWLAERQLKRRRILGEGRTHLTMVHAWPWLDNPDGPFAQQHRVLPYLRAGLPADHAVSGDEAAAWGVSLLADGTCDGEIRRLNALARLSRKQRMDLEAACEHAESSVRGAFYPGVDAGAINAAAAAAWNGYLEVRDSLLTAEQKQRLASVVEHNAMH